ncbi:IS21 family transposase [Leucobacter insecticola]|uniref:IS21 family transposase n=1 Tax=Leucobacter insecticola TaxID=2714934 RepID=A0A6G8FJ05_9MICO|nr:IS21 family transposase [Leucobacter insecticola]QIM16042.1 IS21 family transposase [Leucobacter insecticola]
MVRKINAKLVLKLRAEGLSIRQIEAQGISGHSVIKVERAAAAEGLSWVTAAGMTESDVYERLFPGRGQHESVYTQPEWGSLHKELAKVGVTLKLLHAEYVDSCQAVGSPFMGYDRFCKTYAQYVRVLGVTSRVGHKAGQTVEVDWSGPTMQLTSPATGETTRVYLFVGCLPFSRYGFVEPTLDMRQDTWLRCHVAMFDGFGGSVPRIVPDNLKTGVIQNPPEGEVVLNEAYRELAAHYSAAVIPARIRHPKDKASVENTVWSVATWVIAQLRHQTFSSLGELRAAIYAQMAAFNQEAFQKRAGSRLRVFQSEEQPLLRPLPQTQYEISQWVYGRRVGRDGHVVWEKNRYSVPYTQVGAFADLRVTDQTLEVFMGSDRIASHLLAPVGMVNEYRTRDGDLPDGPGYREWDAVRIRDWAARIGEHTTTVVNRVFESVPVEEQGLDAALAVLRLTRRYSSARVEHACQIALASRVRSPRYAHLRPILESRQDETGKRPSRFEPVGEQTATNEAPAGYVRGASYYGGESK